jgi:hypothetical protein
VTDMQVLLFMLAFAVLRYTHNFATGRLHRT